jgi:hypothetical protein
MLLVALGPALAQGEVLVDLVLLQVLAQQVRLVAMARMVSF